MTRSVPVAASSVIVDDSTDIPAPQDARRDGTGGSTFLIAIYLLAIFTSAFLLFQVQPLISKFILPWFGGTPAVWTTCILFFQVLLFGGYTYAHLSNSQLGPRAQAFVHLGLLIAGCLALPIVPAIAWKPTGQEQPTLRIVLLLAATVGVPFFVLSSTGPLLQGWFSRTHAGRSPYRLYSLSNIGSLLALVTYPFAFDLWFPVPIQARLWSWGFGAFALLCGMCALGLAFRSPNGSADEVPSNNELASNDSPQPAEIDGALPTSDKQPTKWTRALWFALAMVPSILLLATTNQVCLDVASVPFLWVLPLTLYLLSFILCFDGDRWYSRYYMMPAAIVGLVAVYAVLRAGATVPIALQALVYFVALFLCAMFCHAELVQLKPPARYLTSFYLLISAGGAAGGIFVGVLAPLIFQNYFELHVGLFACAVLMLAVLDADSRSRLFNFRPRRAWGLILTGVAGFAVALTLHACRQYDRAVYSSRNFYGVLRVGETEWPAEETVASEKPYRYLVHGRIMHGLQFQDSPLREQPLTYFSDESGVGRVLGHPPQGKSRKVGVLGLGIGTLAAYARPGDRFRFYEINADVPKIARKYFHYLDECRGQVEIVLGDGRLTLERELPQGFDVLVLDAFSSDAVPTHLLTSEAFDIYLKHLAPGGIIAVNVTNRHFALRPVVDAVADAHHLNAIEIESSVGVGGRSANAWMLVSRDRKSLDADGISANAVAATEPPVLWTDNHASMFRVLALRESLLSFWQNLWSKTP